MPTTCEFDFENNPEKVLYPGQLLRGSIKLTLTSEKTVRSIYIRITGKAHCYWTEGTGDDKKVYSGNEKYVDGKAYLYGDENGEYQLVPGTYSYNYQFMLPAELPTSVEARIGYIRYKARVVIEIPGSFNKKFHCPFTVLQTIDLNTMPAMRQPTIAEVEKTFLCCCLLCCCCCPSGPLKITARAPVSGYTPGQTINLEINAINQSDQSISEFRVQLVKQISYFEYANSVNKTSEVIVITEERTRGCEVDRAEEIRVNINIPPTPPTDFTSNIVKVKYLVQIIGSVAGCHVKPQLELPITIGTYPIQDNPYLYQNQAANASVLPSMNDVISTQPKAAQISQSSEQIGEPPTYEEAISTNPSDNNQFKPKYAMFKRSTSYSAGN